MKHLWLFFISFFFFHTFIYKNVNALNLDNLSKYSETQSYCLTKNINNIPLSVKIEQMLFLNWNFKNLNNLDLLDYLKNHHIGGISFSVENLDKNKQSLKNLIKSIKELYTLPHFHTIPYFININCEDFLNTSSEINDQQNIDIIYSLGANIININSELTSSFNNSLESYNNLLNYVKNCNKNRLIVALNKFQNPFHNKNEVNIYGWLIKKGKFNQIIIPDNNTEPKVDNKHYYSLSKTALDENLKTKLRFNGVILNTSLCTENIRNKYTINKIVIDAITSGNNMLYYNGQSFIDNKKFVEQVVNTVTTAINDGIISINDINKSYIRIINLKNQFYIILRKNYC